MRSVLLLSVLSFFVIFSAVFWITGVFSALGSKPQEVVATVDPVEESSLERQSLHARAEEIARREAELQELADAVELEKAVLAAEFSKLDGARGELEEAVGEIEDARERSIRKLAKMYEAMPAKEAAAILSGMDVEIVLGVLSRMKERPAAKIMAALDPARAAVLSSMLGTQNGF